MKIRNRPDLSEWVIHFIHDRDPGLDVTNQDENGRILYPPYTLDNKENSRFDIWDIKEQEDPLDADASAFWVLKRILDDGFIKASWSFREGKDSFIPTIYGTHAACCFTEMPLYALIHYAKQRQNEDAVATYAIALRRDEVFKAGGRPVIYGLSVTHKELKRTQLLPRLLDPSCGISEHEQYRYVAMNLHNEHTIDWSHEREWRWCDIQNRFSSPGLPIWYSDKAIQFSRSLVIVPTNDERDTILDQLKEMHDAGCDPYCFEYNKSAIENTHVISLEQVSEKVDSSKQLIRLEDIPTNCLHSFYGSVPSSDYVKSVQDVLASAITAANQASQEHLSSMPKNADGQPQGPCGFASLIIKDSRSEVVKALTQLKAVSALTGIGYTVKGITSGCQGQVLSEEEAAVEAAKEIFQKAFPGLRLQCHSVLD